MNRFERTVLKRSLKRLQDILPMPPEELLERYEKEQYRWAVEESDGLVYCLFSFPVLQKMEQMILLVYDEENQIIADTGAYHMKAFDFLESTEIYDWLSEESDWMYLLHYVLSNTMFDAYPYPYCTHQKPSEEPGEILLYANAYVSLAFRRRGIFRRMTEMMSDSVLEEERGTQIVYSAMSMDPDIACLGPDAKEEPYYYSYERDEPVRLQNAKIAGHVGFTPLRLEPDHPETETDGTKLWFCIRKELFEIIEDFPS